MKLTTQRLKQLIREELQKLEEGVKYSASFSPHSAAIYYAEEDDTGNIDPKDVEKAKEAIKRMPKQAVIFGDPLYKRMKAYYQGQGFKFDNKGMTEKVRPPNKKEFVEFVFRYVERGSK